MDKYIKKIEKLLKGDTVTISIEIDTEFLFALTTLRNIHFNYESTNLSPRMIHYYSKEGIILLSDAKATGRKKFNFFQILWVHIVESLRNMGYSLENIRAIKGSLFDKQLLEKENPRFGKPYDFNAFEFIITHAILSEDQIYFIALQDGGFSFVSDKSILIYTMDDTYLQEPHINLPLAHLIKGLFEIIPEDSPYSQLSVKWEKPIYEELSAVERGIILDARRGHIKSLTIKLENGKIKRIETEDEFNTSTTLNELIKSQGYQEITFKVRDGQVVHLIKKGIQKIK